MQDGVERGRELHASAIDAACALLGQKDYAAAQRVLVGVLPHLAEDAYQERVRTYMLLIALPDHAIDREMQEDSLRVVRHIFEHREKFSTRYRLWAHFIFGSLKGEWTVDSEKNELFALEEAQMVLTHSEFSREDRDVALTVIASQSPDHGQIRLCLEELLHGANAFAVTQAVTAAPIVFHRETNMRYLEQALDQVKSPAGFVADLLRKKMAVTIRILEEDTDAGVLDRKYFHTQLTMCYYNLRMMPQALWHHAYSEYYLGYAAAYLDEKELGLIHTYTAIAMARQLGLTQLEQLACAVRDHLQSRAPYEGGGKGDGEED